MSKEEKIKELIKSNLECSVALYGKIYRCKIDSYKKGKKEVLIKYDYTNTGRHYFYTTVMEENLII